MPLCETTDEALRGRDARIYLSLLRGALPRSAPAFESTGADAGDAARVTERVSPKRLAGARVASRVFLSDATSVCFIRATVGLFSCATRHAVLKSRACGVDRLHPVKSQFPLSEFAIGESASAVESKNFDRTNRVFSFLAGLDLARPTAW